MDILLISLVSFLVTALSVPITIKLAKRYGLVDDPSKRPHPAHIQQRIVPRAGGLPIYIGILVSSLIFLPIEKYLIGILLGSAVLLVVGLLDDKMKEFSPYLRLGLLSFAALLAVGSGIGITFIKNPLFGLNFIPFLTPAPVLRLDQIIILFEFWGPHKIILIADILAFIWIVTLTQVINWAKGVDGQMGGITLVAAVTLGIFSYKLYLGGDLNQLNVARLAFIISGVSLGFLVFNWHPAKIFPGFSGSTILAFVLAILAILSGPKLATAMLVLAIPIIDFVYTFFRRIIQGKSPVWGDRGHLHHKLLDLGWTHQQISLFYILGSGMLGAGAIILSTSSKLFAVAIIATIFLGFILWLNSFGDYSKQAGPSNGLKTSRSLPD